MYKWAFVINGACIFVEGCGFRGGLNYEPKTEETERFHLQFGPQGAGLYLTYS